MPLTCFCWLAGGEGEERRRRGGGRWRKLGEGGGRVDEVVLGWGGVNVGASRRWLVVELPLKVCLRAGCRQVRWKSQGACCC